MKLNAVGVASSNMQETVRFYQILGFDFAGVDLDTDHVEPNVPAGATRLMIDSVKLMKELIGEEPRHSNHSSFALEYDSVEELNAVAKKISDAGYKIVKEPWDAFWGQRYCVVADPDGYMVDLYVNL